MELLNSTHAVTIRWTLGRVQKRKSKPLNRRNWKQVWKTNEEKQENSFFQKLGTCVPLTIVQLFLHRVECVVLH